MFNQEAWWESDEDFANFLASINQGNNSVPDFDLVALQQPRTESENYSNNKNVSLSMQSQIARPQHAGVYYPPPLQQRPPTEPMSPAGGYRLRPPSPIAPQPVPMVYEPRWISPTGDYHLPPSSQPPLQMIQEPSMPTSNRKRQAQQLSGGGTSKKGRLSKKTWEQIDILRRLIPYPRKQDAVSTLADIVDYVIHLKWNVDRLENEKSGSQTTTAEDFERSGSPIFGLVQMPNQVGGTHDVPTTSSFPVNQTADVAATGVQPTGHEDLSFWAINDPSFYPIV